MGFFKDFKDDFSQAVNDLLPEDEKLEKETNEDDLVVNKLEGEVDVQSELSKLDGLLEQVTRQEAEKGAAAKAAVQQTSALAQSAAAVPPVQGAAALRNETVQNITKATQEEKKMADNVATPLTNQNTQVSDEVSVITEGTVIRGDIVSDGSLDVRGQVDGNVGCNGKLVVTGVVNGNKQRFRIFCGRGKNRGRGREHRYSEDRTGFRRYRKYHFYLRSDCRGNQRGYRCSGTGCCGYLCSRDGQYQIAFRTD